MNNIKTVGGATGIFHIFIPGIFLLLNFVGGLYFFPLTSSETKKQLLDVFANPALSLIITTSFGYLIGVVLRMFRSELADLWSAKFLRRYDKNAKGPECLENMYAYEKFPYSDWVGHLSNRLPESAQIFYKEIWSQHKTKTFLNFCKVLIISEDERAANEIYASESMCRYISGMFYALLASFGILYCVIIADLLIIHKTNEMLVGLVVGYFIAILGILWNFRFMRLKEVKTVFSAAYKNSHLFYCKKIDEQQNALTQQVNLSGYK